MFWVGVENHVFLFVVASPSIPAASGSASPGLSRYELCQSPARGWAMQISLSSLQRMWLLLRSSRVGRAFALPPPSLPHKEGLAELPSGGAKTLHTHSAFESRQS
ncbi:hypothetical protein GCM10025871_36680 [Deinococcus metallilatus]|nr:hypothetical protein GCM10025871_36680 [Deinococcus metallilatus]